MQQFLSDSQFILLKLQIKIKSKRMRWTGHVVRMRKKRNAYRILVGKAEGKRPLGRPGRKWGNIKMDR
jgi:hypothetical protein